MGGMSIIASNILRGRGESQASCKARPTFANVGLFQPIRHRMTHANTAPPAEVAWLGYGGLIPFVALAGLAPVDPQHAAAWSRALAAYGAVILSFVGALHWGIAMSAAHLGAALRRRAFIWSVVPALMAWPAAMQAGPLTLLVLVAGFVLHLWQDRRLLVQAQLPGWYWPLRCRLTAVACLCLGLNAWWLASHP